MKCADLIGILATCALFYGVLLGGLALALTQTGPFKPRYRGEIR